MRHINIPIFIPHLGCPNQCIFCNQRYISGTVEFQISQVKQKIDEALSTVNCDDECEIAFFGGSFTGIERGLMIELLDIAEEYVKKGLVCGIRMSTRPDYISQEILDILKKYTVSFVELGIQSMNDKVLEYLKRGHTRRDTINAVSLLKKNGLNFVGQMMIGLPTASAQDEIECAELICSLGAAASRIYPTLVFKMTELEKKTLNNEYTPLSIDEAVFRCANVLRVFIKNGVECIRIGLCDSDNLHSDETFVSGPNSPSIGEMVKSEIYYQLICESLNGAKGDITIECGKGKTSQLIGHKQKNLLRLKKEQEIRNIKVVENSLLDTYEIKIVEKEENSCV